MGCSWTFSLIVLFLAIGVILVEDPKTAVPKAFFKFFFQCFLWSQPVEDPSGLGSSREMRATEAMFRSTKSPFFTFEELHTRMNDFPLIVPPRADVQKQLIMVPNINEPSVLVPAYWEIPPNPRKDRVILFFHGGALISGHPEHEFGCADEIAIRTNTKVLNVDYRLMSNFSVQTLVSDCVSVYHFLLKSEQYSPDQVIFWGCSGGGMAAILTALQISISKDVPNPSAVFASAPAFGFEVLLPNPKEFHTLPSWVNDAKTDDDIILDNFDIYHTIVDISIKNRKYLLSLFNNAGNLPPTLMHAGSKEALFSTTKLAYEHFLRQNAPVEWRETKNHGHCYFGFFGLFPEASTLLDEMIEWVGTKGWKK